MSRNPRNGRTLGFSLKTSLIQKSTENAFYGICRRIISCSKYFYNESWGNQWLNWNSLDGLVEGHNEFRIFQMVQFMDNSFSSLIALFGIYYPNCY